MRLIFGQLPTKAGWWDAPPALLDFHQSNKHCQSPQLGSQISCPWTATATEHKYDKTRIENWPPRRIKRGSPRLITNGYSHYYLQLLLRKVIIFYIPIHKVLEQPWRHFTSLKLCKCSQIPHPSTRVSSTFCRWHMLRFDTSYKGGNLFFQY